MSKTAFSPVLRTRSAIAGTAIKNGQMLASTDTGEVFVDANNVRVQIGDIVRVADEDALPLAPVAKIYFSEADLCFFFPTYVNGDLIWESLTAADAIARSNALTAVSTAATAQQTATQALNAANTAQYQDITASNGALTITTTKIPVAVEINSHVYIPTGMTRNATTFTIPVAPILAEANLASFDGVYRVWLS